MTREILWMSTTLKENFKNVERKFIGKYCQLLIFLFKFPPKNKVIILERDFIA
jgi:hypothetical protein